MIHSIVSSLVPIIKSLSFADKVGGIVYPLQKKKNLGELVVTKNIPVYGNDPVACESGDYVEMCPDDKKKSVIYFESTPEIVASIRNSYITTTCTLTLIAWFNLSKINSVLKSGENMLRILSNTINGTYNIGDTHAIFTLTNINFRDPAIFAKWSYDEAEKQYLIYPRDFGAITFDVQLSYPICDEEPEITPAC